ncbi:MAG: 50S ribosomal protein L25 [Patescibacteria group bacterium]
MEQIDLTVEPRSQDLPLPVLRKQGFVPAVVYGKGEDAISLSVPLADFQKVFKAAGENTIINLRIAGGEPKMALIKDVQLTPDKGEYLHIDFYKVRVGEKLRVAIPLQFVGEAPAVKDAGGILVTNKNEVEVECLPQNLPHEITVDLSSLSNIDDSITVKDLIVSAGVEILDDAEESIIVVTPPAAEEAETPVSEEEAVAAVEATEEKTESGESTSAETAESKESKESKES